MQPTTCHDSISPETHATVQRGLHTDNTRPSGVVHPSATGNVSGTSNFDRGLPDDETSGSRRSRKRAADVLELYGLEALQQACVDNGLNAAATDAILSQFEG
eukprot:SAG11_NODE_7304_length_1164_cov_2.131455_1_plen_102_part_00